MMILLLAIVGSAAAHADGVFKKKVGDSFCSPPFELADRVMECDANDAFLEEGEKCLDKLDAEEQSVANLLPGAGFSANTKQKQADKFASSGQDYKTAAAALAYLIATSQVAEGEIQAYKFSLQLPPDMDEPDVTRGDELGYAMSVDCYGRNRDNLESLLEDFQTRRHRFETIRNVALANAGISGTRQGNIDVNAIGGQRAVGGVGQGMGAAGVNRGLSSEPPSDITGTAEDKAMREQK